MNKLKELWIRFRDNLDGGPDVPDLPVSEEVIQNLFRDMKNAGYGVNEKSWRDYFDKIAKGIEPAAHLFCGSCKEEYPKHKSDCEMVKNA